MSRLPSRFAVLPLLAIAGCMNQPMYQPYPYGQPMYAPQNGYTQPGTLVIPPSSGTPYQPGGNTYEGDPAGADDFTRDTGSGTGTGNGTGKFFGEDPGGGVPTPKEPSPAGTNAPLTDDLSFP